LPQTLTGVFITIVTKPGFCYCQHFAIADDAFPDILGFVISHKPASVAAILCSEIGQAGSAIHAAGGDQGFVGAPLC